MDKTIHSAWIAENRLVITKLNGRMNSNDIREWKESLYAALKLVEKDSRFKILIDLHGFEAENMDVHKEYRTIMPLLLADYNYRIGYLDMFPEANVFLQKTEGKECVAMANIHHHEEKMAMYQSRFGNEHERYFTVPADAYEWISRIEN